MKGQEGAARRAAVRRALGTLTGDARAVARLRLAGQSYGQIQRALGYRHKSLVWYYWRVVAVPTLRKRVAGWEALLTRDGGGA